MYGVRIMDVEMDVRVPNRKGDVGSGNLILKFGIQLKLLSTAQFARTVLVLPDLPIHTDLVQRKLDR